ncbi:MAG: DUF427 domain-containing protein [Isosphaeraceae bacterium]
MPATLRPGPGQESVWDYPRPPRVEPCSRRIRIELGGVEIARTTHAYRVLETSHPPVYYIPRQDIRMQHLEASPTRSSYCEWKGRASYLSVRVGERVLPDAGWTYRDPRPAFVAIKDHVAFYASKMDACWLDDERVTPQPGDFYGGWISSEIIGPFKGPPGTSGW